MSNQDEMRNLAKTKYNEFIESTNNSRGFITAKNRITLNVALNLYLCITNRVSLSKFKENSQIENRYYCSLIHYFLPYCFSKEELTNYMYDLLVIQVNSLEIGHFIRMKEAYSIIFGLKLNGTHNRTDADFYIRQIFDEAYDKFINTYCWSERTIESTIDAIENKKYLDIVTASFYKKFQGMELLRHLYDNFIIPKIGISRFVEYTDFIAIKHHEQVSLPNNGKLNHVPSYFKSILGIDYDSSNPHYNSTCIKVCYCSILKVLIPYISDKNFNTICDCLNLSDTEKDKLKANASCTLVSIRDANKFSVTVTEESSLKYGETKLKDICEYIQKWFYSYRKKNRVTFKNTIKFKEIFDECDDLLLKKNALWAFYHHINIEYKIYLSNYIDKIIEETKQYYLLTNSEELKQKKKIYILYFKQKDGRLKSEVFDYSHIKSEEFGECLRLFIMLGFYNRTLFRGNGRNKYFNRIVLFLEYTEHFHKLSFIHEITDWHLYALLNNLSNTQNSTLCVIKQTIGAVRIFFNFIIDELDINISINPASAIEIRYPDSHLKSIPSIPEEILVFLDNHISEIKDVETMLIYEILSWTGFRFSDVQRIETSDILLLDENTASISVDTSKTNLALKKNGVSSELYERIPIELYKKIQSYIDSTSEIRGNYNIETLFFRICRGKVAYVNDRTFIKRLNNFLLFHNVKTLGGEHWNFTTRQARKTVAVTLINNGATASDVQQKLGHLSDRTTRKYYAEIDRLKLADLNHEFYKKQFGYLISAKRLELYSEEERRMLYKDFCLHSRETELGICSLHPSEGRCSALSNGSCSNCSKICTGKKWINNWIALINDSEMYLEELERIYCNNGISAEQYAEFIEYKQEKELLLHYQEVVKAIEEYK